MAWGSVSGCLAREVDSGGRVCAAAVRLGFRSDVLIQTQIETDS